MLQCNTRYTLRACHIFDTIVAMRHVDIEERLLRKRLAVRVIALRNEKDWSQSELSRRLGDRTRGRVIRLEKAASGLSPTLGLVALLAKVFGMTPMEFIAPVLAPKDPKLAQRQAVARFQRDIDRLHRLVGAVRRSAD